MIFFVSKKKKNFKIFPSLMMQCWIIIIIYTWKSINRATIEWMEKLIFFFFLQQKIMVFGILIQMIFLFCLFPVAIVLFCRQIIIIIIISEFWSWWWCEWWLFISINFRILNFESNSSNIDDLKIDSIRLDFDFHNTFILEFFFSLSRYIWFWPSQKNVDARWT